MYYIAFDIGQVLCKVDMDVFANELVSLGYMQTQKQAREYCTYTTNYFDIGATNLKLELMKLNVRPLHVTRLLDAWDAVVTPVPEMADLVAHLIDSKYSVALLSNIGEEHAKLFRSDSFPAVYKKCEQFFSYEIGARKPTRLFFKTFMHDHLSFYNNSCLFFDDKEENVDGAKRSQFRGKLFNLSDYSTNKLAAEKLMNIINEDRAIRFEDRI